MKLNIRSSEIQELATNGKVYTRGKAYYQEGYVRELTYRPSERTICAHIVGDSGLDYYPSVTVNAKGRPIDVDCNCKAFRNYLGCCKHLIATMLTAQTVDFNDGVSDSDLPASARLPVPEDYTPQTAESPPASPAVSDDDRLYYPVSQAYTEARNQALSFMQQVQVRRNRAGNREASRQSGARELFLSAVLELPSYSSEMARLEFQIGNADRSYKIKNCELFLDTVIKGNNLYFGKQLTYRPGRHYFDPPSAMILERMIWLYLNDVEKTPFTYQPSCPIFKKQYMMLNAARLYEFLNHYLDENPDFRLDILFHPQGLCRPHIVRGWPEAEFLLEPWIWQDKGKPAFPCYALSLREKTQRQGLSVYSAQTYAGAAQAEGIRLLSKDARMLLYNQTIYLTPDESAALPRLFYTALAGRERIILQEKDMPTLLNLILPVDELRAHLTLDPAVRERIVHSKMSALVRLDRCGQGIIAEVEFHYGKTVINPHPEATDQTDLNQGESSAWLMRDESGERKILTLLTEAGFRDRPPTRISRSDQAGAPPLASTSAYHLYDEEAIYRFLKEMLPRLCAAATVYYSDRFEKIKVHSVPALSGQIRLMSAQNLLEVSFDAREYSVEEIRQILQAYREKRRYTRLKSGDFIELPEYSPDHELTLLEQADLWGAEFAEDGLQIAPYRALPLHALLKERSNGPTSFSTDPDFDRLIDTLARPFEADFAVPTTVRATLRPYQIAGYRWLCGLSHYGFGGILADEMGLGKTLQILLFIEHFKTQVRLPSLVIVPTSLLYNWQNEAAKFFPEMNVLIYSGPKSARLAMAEDLRAADLVVVSYAVARQDIKELREIEFGVCVLDEAQFIKNPLTRTARAVKRIKALRRFALTGTPIENALSELWSIFDFLMPGYLFGHRKFQQEWEIPIVRNKDPEVLEQLVRLTRPFILRRLKKDVLKELPDKIETRLICEMNEEQRTLYDAYLSQARIRARDLLATETGAAGRRQIELLSLLTRLRQICCHPALFLDGYTGGSGKLDSLNDQMERLLSEGHRVLLFSQFTGMLALIQQAQSEQGRSIFYIDGAVSAEERMRRVERFNAGEGDLFLVSLKAGGTGLNIVGADTVIHYDPWWNPAVEEQATDRAHRLGQKRVVQIFRFITRNSIEEKIQELKEHKCRLADRVIRSDPNFLSRLSQEELLALFE